MNLFVPNSQLIIPEVSHMTEKSELSDLKAKIAQNKLLKNKLYLY